MLFDSAVQTLDLPASQPVRVESCRRLTAFYDALDFDSAAWSKHSNLHFGFFRNGTNPLDLEAMLEQMTIEVLARMKMDPSKPDHIAYLGCGLGASMRAGANLYPAKTFIGVTIVASQVKHGNDLHRNAHLETQAISLHADYSELPFEDSSFDYVYAIESAMHARGPAKRSLVREAARVLKSGGRFITAEPFLKRKIARGPRYCLIRTM
jgi:MPBQ/MSBQ methyltransferase